VINRRLASSLVPAILVAAFMSARAEAHPHVLVDAKSEIVFDAEGRMAAVRQIWRFDPAFSAYAIQGLDENGDGELSAAELEPLAKINVESLQEFDFFTYLAIDGKELPFAEPREYWLEQHNGQLTLFYELPLKTPTMVAPETTLEVFDPEYFVAFNFVEDNPVSLVGAPDNCSATYHPPRELDSFTMAMLGALPQDQRELPPDLAGAADALTNIAEIECQ